MLRFLVFISWFPFIVSQDIDSWIEACTFFRDSTCNSISQHQCTYMQLNQCAVSSKGSLRLNYNGTHVLSKEYSSTDCSDEEPSATVTFTFDECEIYDGHKSSIIRNFNIPTSNDVLYLVENIQ